MKTNIPIFIVGTKINRTIKQNFIRRVKFELDAIKTECSKKIEIIKNRIYCLDSSKESYLSLLKSVYEEFLISKNISNKVIELSSDSNSEEIINQSKLENSILSEGNYNDEKSIALQIYNYAKESIFFNNYIEKIERINKNVMAIKKNIMKRSIFLINYSNQRPNAPLS